MYTKDQLTDRKITKSEVADITLDLQNEVEVLKQKLAQATGEAGAVVISNAEVIKEKVAIAREVTAVNERLVVLTNQKDVAIAEIEAKYKAEVNNELEAVLDRWSTLEDAVSKVDELFKSDLEIKEAEYNEDMKQIETALEEAKSKHEESILELAANLKKAEVDNLETISVMESQAKEGVAELRANLSKEKAMLIETYERETNKIEYDHAVALDRKDGETLTALAEKLGVVLMPKEEFDAITKAEKASKDEISAEIAKAVNATKSALVAKYEGEAKDAKFASELEINSLKSSVTHQTALIEDLQKRIADQDEQIKAQPANIAKAIEAIDSTINMNNEIKK